MEAIAKTIEEVLQKLTVKQAGPQQKISDALGAVLSAQERGHAEIEGIKDGVLLLRVDSPNWKFALNLKKRQILSGIKEKSGENIIKEIKMIVGRLNNRKTGYSPSQNE